MGCVQAQQLFLTEEDPQLLSIVLWAVVWAVSQWLPNVSWLQDPLAGLSSSCPACVEAPELQPGQGPCYIPIVNPLP